MEPSAKPPPRGPQLPPGSHLTGWLPATLFLVLIAIIRFIPLPAPPPWLSAPMRLPVLIGPIASGAVAVLLGKRFLATGAAEPLLLGSGLLIWTLSSLEGALLGGTDPNTLITISNLGLLMAALIYLLWAMLPGTQMKIRENALVHLVSACSTALGVVGLLGLGIRSGWIAPFFVQGQGGTMVRQIVLVTAMFIMACTVFLMRRVNQVGTFAHLFSRFLLMLVIAHLAFLLQRATASWMTWTGRIAYCWAGIDLLLGARMGARDPIQAAGSLDLPEHEGWRVYLMATCLIFGSFGIRIPFLTHATHPFIFSTFFPAVMLAALLGGRGPGLLATTLSIALTMGILGRESHLPSPEALLSLAIFSFSGVTLSIITDLMHRAQARASAAEAREKAAHELDWAQAELRRTVAELTRSNEDLQRFAYVASHDLQEPLRMISAYLDLLRQRYQGSLDGKADQYLAYAAEGAARMHRLIHDLLAYSRLGAHAREYVPTFAGQALDSALAALNVSLAESGALVSLDPMPMVPADPVQLAQVFQNLLGNAIKFSGDRQPDIHIGYSCEDGQHLFTVADQGIGIPEHALHRIFDLFQRVDHGRNEVGTGIGLAVCKRIIEGHGGRIWVESDPGRGSRFRFTLPRQPGGPD